MPKRYRLTTAEFRRLPRAALRRAHGKFFTVSVYPLAEGVVGPKMASVVSKKVSPRAVDRNKIERRCREVMKKYLSHLGSSHAYVLQAKKDALTATFEQLDSDIKTLLKL